MFMKTILLVWTIFLLLLEVKATILKLNKKEQRNMEEQIEDHLKMVENIADEKTLMIGAVFFSATISLFYCYFIASYLKVYYVLSFTLIFGIVAVYIIINSYIQNVINKKDENKATLPRLVMNFYNIGYLMFMLYSLIAE